MERIAIQDPQVGKRAGANFVTLFWVGRDFFAEKSTVRIEFFDDNERYLDHHDHEVIIEQFMLTGETREQRANALLVNLGILKAE
ncbi:hypothetical protein [Pedobacter sp. SL55]|uniref:hypothetical protein n=1 Tax=Pedobacter sp. SL55 TaxID=2995161 RepID=UPI00227091C8|nr:hypothetical protein [Pedobacter sp. SL55]WAC40598.1 hypothetical protein OVA16_18835 [Pedobacter sp. SL55]